MARFKSFDVTVKSSGILRRIAKIEFSQNGSIYVFFPGFINTEGIVCRARMRAGESKETTINLTENGRVTSHLVKYAHHPDGETHFSQDGKVKTEVRRKSIPLNQQKGHLFTIQIQSLESFRLLQSPRKEQLTFEVAENTQALKITGWRFRFTDLKLPEGVQPLFSPNSIQTSDGLTRFGLFVAPPEGQRFDDTVLFLGIKETPVLSKEDGAHLIFLGGFDPVSIALDHSQDSEFLAFAYPCSDFERLKNLIGCIDLQA